MTEHDPYWQARDGLERLSGAPLARPDSWSWAESEGTFRPTSPAWNTALGLGYEGLGLAGIALVGALGMLLYFGVALLVARRLGARPLPILVATAAVAVLALPMISPRATIVVEALLVGSLALGHSLLVRPLARVWSTYGSAALAGMALGWVGAWLHVSWSVIALGVAAIFPLLALLAGAARWRLVLVGIAGLALAIGSLWGPYGWSVWQLLLDVSSASGGQIIEWLSPFTAGLRARWIPVAVLCLALAGMCAIQLARHRRGTAGSPERARWALEVVLVTMSLTAALAGLMAIRFLGVAALTLLPVLAYELSAATVRWRASPSQSQAVRTRLAAPYWRPILTGVLVILLPLAIAKSGDPGLPRPESEIAGSLPPGCQLFTSPDTAGALLLLRPDVRVWIDMRTEVHGSAAYAEARRRLQAPGGVTVPAGSTCAVLPPSVRTVTSEGSEHPWGLLRSTSNLRLWVPA